MNPESVGELRNQWVYVTTEDRPALPEGEFYYHQLLGLEIVSDEGRNLGRITGILETGANDVYIVRSTNGHELLLPAIKPVILDIDLQLGKIIVHLLPGLLES
jgi:16S rRNA processing protein RimM